MNKKNPLCFSRGDYGLFYYVYLLRDELLSDSFLLSLVAVPAELLLLLLLLLEEELALLACCLDVVVLVVLFAGSDLFTG